MSEPLVRIADALERFVASVERQEERFLSQQRETEAAIARARSEMEVQQKVDSAVPATGVDPLAFSEMIEAMGPGLAKMAKVMREAMGPGEGLGGD